MDDYQDLAKTTVAPLNLLRFDAVVFLTTKGCLMHAHGNHPDISLIDIEITEMDGYRLCRILRTEK